MNGKNTGSVKVRRSRTIKVAPVTRAVRLALAASVTALALGVGGNAFAADCGQAQKQQISVLRCESASIDSAPVFDLTVVPNALIGPSAPAQSLIGDGSGSLTVGIGFDFAGDLLWTHTNGFAISSATNDVQAMHGTSGGNIVLTVGGVDVLSANSDAGYAVGIYTSASGTNSVTNSLAIAARGYTDAAGIASFGGGDVTVANSGAITADAYLGNAYGILAVSSDGNTNVTNSAAGNLNIHSVYGNAYGIWAGAGDGDVGIDNAAYIHAHTTYGGGTAVGVFGTSGTGDVTIDNSGDLIIRADDGIADGIFASGANVGVNNTGSLILVEGSNWAAGIEAQGDTAVTVTNSGTIVSNAEEFLQVYVDGVGTVVNDHGGQAFGIFATGGTGGAVIGNEGDMFVYGGTATGISAQSAGDTTVTNSGTIVAGNGLSAYYGDGYALYYGTENATGIYAGSNGEGAVVSVGNAGDIFANGTFSANGIVAASSGADGTASVINADSLIYARADYGNTYGIVASADGDANVNADGVIVSVSGETGTGVAALSFNGEASIVNTGSVYAISTLNSVNVEAIGLVAFTANGSANVNNEGYVYAHGVKNSTGIEAGAGGSGNVTVTNSGDIVAESSVVSSSRANGISVAAGAGNIEVENSGSIYASGAVLAFGIYSSSATGDTQISNAADGDIEFYSYAGRGFGMFAFAEQGDVSIDNDADIHGYAWQQAYGARVRNLYGDVTITNSGSIDVESGNSRAFGLHVSATYEGSASITNNGDITAYARTAAYGVRAYAYADAMVGNSGSITAIGNSVGVGILARTGAGDVTVSNTGGSIYAVGGAAAYGILVGAAGNASVTNASEITAFGINNIAVGIKTTALGDVDISNSANVLAGSDGDAIGIYGYSVYGDTTIDNSAQVVATSYYGLADGIFASGQDVTVTNSGYVVADTTSGYYARGIEAQGSYSVQVTNSGDIVSQAMPHVQAQNAYGILYSVSGGTAYGIYATGGFGGAAVNNRGYLSVDAGYATGIEVQSAADISVINSGDIAAGSSLDFTSPEPGIYIFNGTQFATGISASSNGEEALVAIANTGNIMADSIFGSTGIAALSGGLNGIAFVDNDGDITALQYRYAGGGSYGVVATADGDAMIDNGGAIVVQTGGTANGLTALSMAGDAMVVNSGDLDVTSYNSSKYNATGIEATAAYGAAYVHNSGSVTVYSSGTFASSAYAVNANGREGVLVKNSGALDVEGKYAYGVKAVSSHGDVDVVNEAGGDIYFLTDGFDYNGYTVTSGFETGFGIYAAATTGEATVINHGTIDGYSYSKAVGIQASSMYGDASVGNYGNIDLVGRLYGGAGVVAIAEQGTATVVNAGDISFTNVPRSYRDVDNAIALGIVARGDHAQVQNSGDITLHGRTTSVGITANSLSGSSVVSTAASTINVYSEGVTDYSGNATTAIGIDANSLYGDTSVVNASTINVENAGSYAIGINATAQGEVTEEEVLTVTAAVTNIGDITVSAQYSDATGISAQAVYGDATVQNSGDINAHGYGYAYGIVAMSDTDGTAMVANTGDVTAQADDMVARGVYAGGYSSNVTVNNSSAGSIDATGGFAAVGVHAYSELGDIVINNSGSIHAGDTSIAIGVLMQNYGGTSTLNNNAGGTISADSLSGASYAWAVQGGYAVDTINNAGTITGAVATSYGDDVFNNKAGGLWDVGSTWHTDFGDGDDTINNAVGGTILLDSAGIYLGGNIDGNAFNNAGKIKVNGDSLIDMGSGYSGEGGGGELAATSFGITPMAVFTPSVVPSLNPLPLVNTGVIDMVDGVADDSLTLVADLGGNGALNIDVSVPNNTADHLIVDGSMAAGAVQTVNASFHPSLLAAAQSGEMTDFAWVTGNSSAGSFVGGQVVGFSASNFLSLGVTVTSSLSANNSADDVFSIGVAVNGLNDAGTLAANAASGAAGMLNAQVGTFRQRMGVNPYGDAGKVMSAFFRTYTSEGDVNPTHAAANFGDAGNFAYDQSVWGREVGVNANLFGNVHAGLVLGTADGRQRLTGDGAGTSRMDGMTWGMYATWFAPQGFYVDVSGRWMAVDIVATSAGGQQAHRTHTGAWNVEAGYEWKLGGMSIVPQAQYTRTTVDGISAIHGDAATFQGHGGVSERGRLGVEINKQFQTVSGVRWMPYASINAVREFDGEMTYTVADDFHGSTGTKGTSTMAELGIGVQKGDWGFSVGANWTDGGAFKSTVGGQALLRFSW